MDLASRLENRPLGPLLASPRINRRELVMITVLGQVCSPVQGQSPYRIGQDGVPRILPGTGGIVLSHRIGDPCVGIAGDHIEPAVSVRHEGRAVKGGAEGPNHALQTLAAVGNLARVVSGHCANARGVVTGKHGGIDTVLVDFPLKVLRRLAIGDRIQIYACGAGMHLLDHPDVSVFNASPRLLARWGLSRDGDALVAPVTHVIPAKLMGSGLGRAEVARGDYDIQMFDAETVRRYRLGSLRFGDMVAIVDADHRFGRAWRGGHVAVGTVVHGESTVAGHGPGVATLLTGPAAALRPMRDPHANLARILEVRPLSQPRPNVPLVLRERHGSRDRPREARREIGTAAGGSP